jgi:toxin YoeB
MRKIILQDNAVDDMMFFASNNLKLLKKIIELMDAAGKDPFTGIGKPEPLKENLKGYWSRRINNEHRIIYEVTNDSVVIISCRSHYNQ